MKRLILAIALMATGIQAEIKRCPFEQELAKIYVECASNEATMRKLLGWQVAWGYWLAEANAQYPDSAKMSWQDANYATRMLRMYFELMAFSEPNGSVTCARFPLEKMLMHLYINSTHYKLTAANIQKISDEYKKWAATDHLSGNGSWSPTNGRYYARISTMVSDLVFLSQPV